MIVFFGGTGRLDTVPADHPTRLTSLPLSVTLARRGRGVIRAAHHPKKTWRLLGCVSSSSQSFEKDDSA
ncbi:hypothetical protein PBY51_021124 [Eleginops maclovinus]|uniref:Uncharacterized protein n=1 Tax=Eleginops maclovinus TaxID=56733 RepID=A0AAN8AKK5_ELEMC|nr:hypothetical protein PBY51_021124 [Eleginops maclovinus]